MQTFIRLIIAAALAFGFTFPASADFEQEDLVCETTTHSGTGRTTVNLAGACTNWLGFLSGGVDSGDTVTYTFVAADGKIETGHATFTDAAPDTLTSITVLASSDGVGTALNLSGTTSVYLQWNSHSFGGGVGLWNVDTITVGSTGLTVGSSTPFSDSAGTLTLQNVDALDATTESTIEGAIDTLSNLTSVGTLTTGTWSATDVAVAAGGTGASDAATARTNLGAFGAHNIQVHTATGTHTPTSGTLYSQVVCVGAGGGGGSSDSNGDPSEGQTGGGGEGGGAAIIVYNSTEMGATAAVTIGAGGAGGVADSTDNGTDGGDTSFNPVGTGGTITASGGDGGEGHQAGEFGSRLGGGYTVHEGVASGGDINLYGQPGQNGGVSSGNSGTDVHGIAGGVGGNSYLGMGASGGQYDGTTASTADLPGESADDDNMPGGGGGGAITIDSTTAEVGGDGANGMCVVYEFGA